MINRFLICVLCISLFACGGSDSDTESNPNTQPLTITEENALDISSAVLKVGFDNDLPSADGFLDLLGGLSQSKPSAEFATQSKQQLVQLFQAPNNFSEECEVSGSFSIEVDIATQGSFTSGDSISVIFDNCNDGESQTDGQLVFTINTFTLAGINTPTEIDVSLLVNNLSTTEEGSTYIVDGDFNVSFEIGMNTVYTEFSANQVSVTRDGVQEILAGYNFTTEVSLANQSIMIAASGSVSSDELGGTLSFDTVEPFVLTAGSDNPISGSLRITGADGSSVTIVALDDLNVRLDIDTDGDGVIDVSIETTWFELDVDIDD